MTFIRHIQMQKLITSKSKLHPKQNFDYNRILDKSRYAA